MPLTMQSFNFAIKCDENELEMYDVKQEGPNSTTAFMASEAEKVSVFKIPFVSMRKTNYRDQQFRIMVTNNLSDFGLYFFLYIDGEYIKRCYVRVGEQFEIQGTRTSSTTRLPFKFQELELVGAFHEHSLDIRVVPHLLLKSQTWNMPLSGQKWGQLNFGPIAAGPWAVNRDVDSHIIQSMDCIKDAYRSSARRQGGIMSGATLCHLLSHPSNSHSDVMHSALQTRYPPINADLQ